MDLKSFISLLIIIAAFGSALWNVHVKKSTNRLIFVTLMVIPQLIVTLPITLLTPLPSWQTCHYIFYSCLIQTGYIIFICTAYKHGLLNRIYPLAIGTAPLLSMIFWHQYFGISSSERDYYGILLLSLGVISFTFVGKWDKDILSLRGILYAFGTSVFIFTYSIIDTFGIHTVKNPLTYISWIFVVKAIILLIPMLYLHKIPMRTMARESSNYIVAGLLAGFGYAVAMFAFTLETTSVVLALRSTSIIFAFILSIIYLNEKASIKIFIFTLSIMAGVFLLLMN
jgi:uncharacterized membrane protein